MHFKTESGGERYHIENNIKILYNTHYRGKRIGIFISGDYEFLCNIYGLSGASGEPKQMVSNNNIVC